MNTSRHPDTASHVFSSLTVSFHICLSFLEYPAHNMGISFMLRARTLAFVPRVAVRGRSARRAREMWLAQINLRATPGTRRKLQPPACCNKLAFSSNINSGPWTHTSPEARRFRILSSDINSEPCIHTYIHTALSAPVGRLRQLCVCTRGMYSCSVLRRHWAYCPH